MPGGDAEGLPAGPLAARSCGVDQLQQFQAMHRIRDFQGRVFGGPGCQRRAPFDQALHPGPLRFEVAPGLEADSIEVGEYRAAAHARFMELAGIGYGLDQQRRLEPGLERFHSDPRFGVGIDRRG